MNSSVTCVVLLFFSDANVTHEAVEILVPCLQLCSELTGQFLSSFFCDASIARDVLEILVMQ